MLVDTIKKIVYKVLETKGESTDFTIGEVKLVGENLYIKLADDDKLTIPLSKAIIPARITAVTPLGAGDKLAILTYDHFQKFYVIDRM